MQLIESNQIEQSDVTTLARQKADPVPSCSEKVDDDDDSRTFPPINQDTSITTPKTDYTSKLQEQGGQEEQEYMTGIKLFAVISVVTTACFTMMLDTSIVATAVPKITTEFHSLSDVGWYGSSYLISNCALQPLTGKLYGQFNSKWIFLSFLALFELGSLLCGTAVSSTMLIIGRSVAGLGASGMTNGALTIISACVPLQKRALYLGIMMSFAQIGTLLGPVIGGALTTYTSWRWCFYINLPIGGIVAFVMFIIQIPQRFASSPPKKGSVLKSLDLVGFGLFAPTAVTFLLALEWGGTKYPWANPRIIALFCLSGVLLIAFTIWEHHRGMAAMIPLPILGKRVVVCSVLYTFFLFSSMMISAYYLPIYFQAVLDATAVRSGTYTLAGVLPQMLFASISGYLVGRLGYYLPWSIATGVLTAIAYGLLSTLDPHTTTATWVGFQILGGVGRGCGLQMSVVAVQNNLPPELLPVAMSLVVFAQNLGGALSLAVAQTVFSKTLTSSLRHLDPTIDPIAIIDAGASGFRDVIGSDQLGVTLVAYSKGVDTVFYIAAGTAVGAFCAATGMGWKSVKAKKAPKDV